MGDTQLKIHLRRLVELEYLVVHRNGRGQAYELAYDGRGRYGERFLPGLIDPEELSEGERSGSGRGPVGPRPAGGRVGETAGMPSNGAVMNAAISSDHEIGQPGRPRERVAVVGGEAR
jgi:YD repeat-containing protein